MTEALATVLARLDTVTLADLVGEADLQTRKDRKYIVPTSLLASVLEDADLRVLDMEGKQSFRYESVYFDTPDLVCYRGAALKRRRRFKVRTRSYLDSGLSWLEVKTREGRSMNTKTRLPYDIGNRAMLTASGVIYLQEFERISPVSHTLRPAITTRYQRTTLLHQASHSRITIDSGVEWETPDGGYTSLTDMAIVETKTTEHPCGIDHRLWQMGYRPTKMSKYCTGLAALNPELPANKWNRVLRTHFNWKPAQREPASATLITRPDRMEVAADIRPLSFLSKLLRSPEVKENYS